MIREIPTDRIDARSDARQIDEATVSGLVDSIGTVGLINPIRVRAVADRWEAIAGMHRLAACKRLGLVEIAADVIETDDLHAELAMIDENLCRAELSPADRASQTARRKAIYLELHPETAHGGDRKSQTLRLDTAERFTKETAVVSGSSERLVQLNAERGEKVIPEVMEMIRGTKLDTGTYLDKIKKYPPNDQFAAAKRDLALQRGIEREKARNGISRRVAALDVDEVREKQVAALMAAWNKASEEARAEFLAAIDTPVFDRSAA
jgi:ParB-like chromosome segregation protein Spo0J